MAIIRSLAVNVTARTKQFESGMKRSSKVTQGLRGSVLNATKSLIPFKLGLAAAAAAAVALVKSQLATIDSLGKTADKIGVTTEALAGLRLAAELTGVAAGGLDKGLEKFIIRLSEARAGTGEAVDALNDLNLSADELINLSPDKAFIKVAESLQGIDNTADQARIAYDLFGRAGVDLVNTLRLGADGLADVQKQAVAAGQALSRIEVRSVEDANDAITILKATLKGMGGQVTTELAPAIEGTANLATEITKQTTLWRTYFAVITSGISEIQIAGLSLFADTKKLTGAIDPALSGRGKEIAKLETERAELFATAQDIGRAILKTSNENKRAINRERFEIIQNEIKRVSAEIRALEAERQKAIVRVSAQRFKAAGGGPVGLGGSLLTQVPVLSRLGAEAAVTRLGEEAAATAVRMNNLTDAMKSFADAGKTVFDRTRTPLEQFRKEIQDIQQLLLIGAIDLDTFARAAILAREGLAKPDAVTDITGPGFVRNPVLEAGSNAAVDAIQRALGFGQQSEQKKQTGELKKQTGLLGAIDQNTRELAEPETVGLPP